MGAKGAIWPRRAALAPTPRLLAFSLGIAQAGRIRCARKRSGLSAFPHAQSVWLTIANPRIATKGEIAGFLPGFCSGRRGLSGDALPSSHPANLHNKPLI